MLTLVARVSQLRRVHPPFYAAALVCLLLTAFFIAGTVIDPRSITGAPAWLKPAKFAFSLLVYSFSMLWALSFLDGWPRFVRFAGWWIIGVIMLEVGIIALQAARGVTSHFNFTTTPDALLFAAMGAAITSLWLLHLVVTVLMLRQKLDDPVLAASLRWGLALVLVGMAQAFLMVLPTAGQLTDLHAGLGSKFIGAHSVGVSDGGPGLLLVGWNTQGGDLRIGHFVGIHALQVLPLLGWWLARSGRLLAWQQRALLTLGAASYLALMLLLTVQALRGQSVLKPDLRSLGLLLGVLLGMVTAVLWILRRSGRSRLLDAR